MNLDFFTITALADEFRLELMGGRVQQITQITPLSYGLEIYAHRQRRALFLSANPQSPRVHLQSVKARRGEGNQTPLFQLFRKYLKGSLLMSVEQPPYERLLLLHFSGREGDTTLLVELLGNRGNLLLLDDGKRILALARPTSRRAERKGRALLPGHPYELPPAQNKLDPLKLNRESLRSLIRGARPDKELAQTLTTHLAGLSPLIAHEIVFRAYGNAGPKSGRKHLVRADEGRKTKDEPVGENSSFVFRPSSLSVTQVDDFDALLRVIQQMYRRISEHRWEPHLVLNEAGNAKFFAPFSLDHISEEMSLRAEKASGMSAAVEAHFLTRLDAADDGYAAARQSVQKRIKKAEARLKHRLTKLDGDAAGLKDPELYRQKGEAILAYSAHIRPRQTELQAEWLDASIALDPALSPPENAQRYFARYKKAKRAAKIIPQQQNAVALKLTFLKQLSLDLELAENRPEIDAAAAALQEAGLDSRRGKRAKKVTAPASSRKFTSPDGFTARVGRNALDNHRLTFRRAKPNDVWLHARGQPGAHVVISASPGKPPRSTLLWAAGLAAYFSKGRGGNQVEVSYTLKKHVRAIKGAPPGMATLRQEKTVRVSPLKPDE
ncbi:MAG TPA: fibronectin-binding domain-containing protein [Chloroflexi bacterium]|nr:fibronectin-binding domain-containing protein [Chloroflexota bacterium]